MVRGIQSRCAPRRLSNFGRPRIASEPKAVPKRILVVDYKSVASRHEGFAGELRNDRRQTADGALTLDTSAKPRPDDALVSKRLLGRQQSHRREHGHYCTGAGPARRSIDLRVCENRDVLEIHVRRGCRASEDRAVDPVEPGLLRMLDRQLRLELV